MIHFICEEINVWLITWICLIAAPKIDKFDVFFSSAVTGNCLLSDSKHSFKWARRFFSNLLCTSRVPARTVDGLLRLLKYINFFANSHYSFCSQ